MNIFVTSPSPRDSAEALDLKRVVKMITESYQLLSNALHLNGLTPFYRLSHLNHPCSHWVAQSSENYRWLLQHATYLCEIYTAKYGRIHKCQAEKYGLALDGLETLAMTKAGGLTPFTNCTEFKDDEVTVAYRKQLVKKWDNDKQPPRWHAGDDHRWRWKNAYPTV